jgi:very-short-patch-repair endonuclease
MSKLIKYAKNLRKNMTDAERILWQHLRAHRLNGAKFKRQQPIANYIVDFICFDAYLIVELDGGQHAEQVGYDQKRDVLLREYGFTVLRFWNDEAIQNTDGVLTVILEHLERSKQFKHSLPSSLPKEDGIIL